MFIDHDSEEVSDFFELDSQEDLSEVIGEILSSNQVSNKFKIKDSRFKKEEVRKVDRVVIDKAQYEVLEKKLILNCLFETIMRKEKEY